MMSGRLTLVSLRARLIAGFAVLLSLILVVGGVGLLSGRFALARVNQVLRQDVQIADLCRSSQTALGQVRQNEKDYLLRFKALGYREAKARYGTMLRVHASSICANMAAIRAL